ncbi:MAG: VWA domain-containing protein [archaeon]
MVTFTFEHPQYLFLLFIIPLIVFIHFLALNNKKKLALRFANFDAIGKIQGIDFFSKNLIVLFLTSLVALFMVLAVSGLTLKISMESSSFSYVLAIDNSDSMEADDFIPNRLEAAKDTASGFVDVAPLGVKMGVISFSGNAYILKDLTLDKGEVKTAINRIDLEGFGGTDLFEAVITSTNMLKAEEHRAVVLLSDGQINVGNLDDIIDYAHENNVIIHTIGIGTEEGGRTYTAFSKLDEESLKSLSYNTGGNYTHAVDNEALRQAYLNILGLTRKNVSLDLTTYLVLFATILFLIEFFLTNTKYINLI